MYEVLTMVSRLQSSEMRIYLNNYMAPHPEDYNFCISTNMWSSHAPAHQNLPDALLGKHGCRERVRPRWKTFSPPPPPQARENRINIFTLNRKDWLSVAEWLGLGLRRLICTVNKKWYCRERQKYMQRGFLPNGQGPEIFKHHPPTPRFVGTDRETSGPFDLILSR
jgi:hypothetical protein